MMTQSTDNAENAAVTTLKLLGYTYCEGAALWKPPIGCSPFLDTNQQVADVQKKIYDSITRWREAFDCMHRRAMKSEMKVISMQGGES